jgi:transposase
LKVDRPVLPSVPPAGLTCGIDWASDDHAVSVVDGRGVETRRWTVEHTDAGLRGLLRRLDDLGVREVAIERPDGPVVAELLEAGLTVVVISPSHVKNLRGRYGSAGNKDDRFDAFVLAGTLRTDRSRLGPLTPDTPATVTLRQTCRARKDLVRHRVALANQLRAHLLDTFPGAVGLFSQLDSAISLRFLHPIRLSRPRRLALGQTPGRLAAIGRLLRPSPSRGPPHPSLAAAARGTTGPQSAANAQITQSLVKTLACVVDQIRTLNNQIAAQLAAHTDAHIFTSLPRSGCVRAARLLGEIGDCRTRFPTPESLACLAGVAPSIRQSGKQRVVGSRWAADNQLRDAVCDFADDSRRANPWAADLYHKAVSRGHDHPHAVRILARAWLYIIWRCWQDHTAHDPAHHRALQRLLDHQQAQAA